MYENFVPERIAQLRTHKGVSARDMSLSLGQANNYINNIYICKFLINKNTLNIMSKYDVKYQKRIRKQL